MIDKELRPLLKKEEKERPSLSPYEGNDLLQDRERITNDIQVSREVYDRLFPAGTQRTATKWLQFVREVSVARICCEVLTMLLADAHHRGRKP